MFQQCLRITPSNNLGLPEHIKAFVNKALKKIGLLRKSKPVIERRSLSHMYITVIRPLIEYASEVHTVCTRTVEKVQLHADRSTVKACYKGAGPNLIMKC